MKKKILIIVLFTAVIFGIKLYSENNNEQKTNEKDSSNSKKVQEDIKYDKIDDVNLNDYIDNLDKLLLRDIDIKEEELIESSNLGYANSYIGEMYNNKVSNEYKVAYSLDKNLKSSIKISNKKYERLDSYICKILTDKLKNDCNMIMDIHFNISAETLNKLTSKIFNDVEIKDNFETKEYNEINSIKCKNNNCKVSIHTGYKGKSYEYYSSKIINKDKENNETIYEVKAFYCKENIENETVELYDKYKGEKIAEMPKNEFLNASFDELAKRFDNKDISYVFKFNKKTGKFNS